MWWLLAAACASRPSVVVVGGGPAGLAAGIEAAACGRVTVLEGRDAVGGSAVYGDALTAAPSAEALAILDDEAGRANAARTRFVAGVQTEVIDWVAALGVPWRTLRVEPDGTTLFEPQGRGAAVVGALAAELERRGGITRLGVRVDQVERGWLVHVGDETLSADRLVLATGGFAGNLDRVRERLDLGDVPLLRGAAAFADGNGIALATGVGGVERSPSEFVLYAHGVPAPDDATRALMLVDGAHTYPIDRTGAYFAAAQTPRGDSGQALLGLPGGIAWAVLDQKALRGVQLFDSEARHPVPILPTVKARGLTATTLEDLANQLMISPDAIRAGIVALARDTTPAHPLIPSSAWGAVPLRLTTAKSLTGVEIDLDGRVLDATGSPIAGLYAAGELAGFAHPWEGRHIDSTMVSGAILTGRAAGRAVCADILR